MLANGTRIIHDVSGRGTCRESEKDGEVLVAFDEGFTGVVKLTALKLEVPETEVRRVGEGSGGTVHTLFVPPPITPEQQAWIEHRQSEQRVASAFQVMVFNGDVYGRSSLGQVEACDPDGNIRQNETWPTRGVPLEQAEAGARSA